MILTNSLINEINNSIQYLMNRVDENGRFIETAMWFALYVNDKRIKPYVNDILSRQIDLLKMYCKIENNKIVFEEDQPVFLSVEDKETYIKLFSEFINETHDLDLYQIRADEIRGEKFDMNTIKPLLNTIIITE